MMRFSLLSLFLALVSGVNGLHEKTGSEAKMTAISLVDDGFEDAADVSECK